MSKVQHGGQCSGQKPRSVKGVTEALSSSEKTLSQVGVMEPDLSWGDHAGC